jgi:hypothetical protein
MALCRPSFSDVYMSTIDFPSNHSIEDSARSWLTCLVARHSGPCRRRMRVNELSLSLQRRHFPAGCAVRILGSHWRRYRCMSS